jgi:Tfp pilus assembly protein PilF
VLLCASCATGAREDAEKKNPKELAQLYTDSGTEALLRGEYTQAVEDLRKALVLDDKNAMAHNHLGLSYYGLGRKTAAKAEIERAVEIDHLYSDAHVNLSRLALDANNHARAREELNMALDNLEWKQRHRALTNLAQLDLAENKLDDARQLLYQSLQVNPDYCLSHLLLGSIFMRDGKAARAAEEFKKSVKSTCAGNVEGHYQMGLAYMKAREYSKARATLSYLVDKYPQSLQAQRAGELLRDIP